MSEINILDKIEWAIQTIRDQLLFGRDELGAAKAREMRAKGVLLDCKEEITRLKKALDLVNKTLVKIGSSNDDMKYFNIEIDLMVKEAQKQIKEVMEGK